MASDLRDVVALIARVRELANGLLERELEARGIKGIQPAHGSVLAFLFLRATPVRITEVVQNVRRVKSTVTGMINTLARSGYVRKTPSADDGRVIYVALTKKGAALRAHFEEISGVLREAVYGTMPQGDRETVVRLLTRVEKSLRGSRGGRHA